MAPPVPRRREYDIIIVGAGVLGLFTALYLSQRMDPGRILILEKGYLSAGASGRNGGGVRQQWETVPTIRLAQESVASYRRFPREFGYNPWFRQGGYLFLALDENEEAILGRTRSVLRREGLPVEWLEPRELGRLVPALSREGIRGGNYLRSDGVIFPFPVLWGLYQDLRRRGVEILLGTEAQEILRSGGHVAGVRLPQGRVDVPTVVNAAGGWSREVSLRAGLTVVNQPSRHEILATEPLKPFLDPMVVTLRRGLYFSQSMRGEIIGGLTLSEPAGGDHGMPSSSRFLGEMARELVRYLPALTSVRVLRAWAGFYDDTPDGLPVMGEDPRLAGFIQANGFGGHGFMLAPAAGRRVAQIALGEPTDLAPGVFSPDRFQTGGPPPVREGLQLG